MSRLRRSLLVAAVAVLGLAGCTADDPGGRAGERPPAEVGSHPLPFGLEQIEGIEPIGRPAVYDQTYDTADGEQVVRRLVAAYRVHDDDPVEVFRRWADQFGARVVDGRGPYEAAGHWVVDDPLPGPWLGADWREPHPGRRLADSANLQLWTTDDDPVILVEVDRWSEGPLEPAVNERYVPSRPPVPVADTSPRGPGELLFEEGRPIHLPPGTRSLTATFPTPAGTGGSWSVIAAEDGPAAVRALLDEAAAADEAGTVDEPTTTRLGDVVVHRAGFVVPAGGWSFSVVAVQGPGDDAATLYVRSGAD